MSIATYGDKWREIQRGKAIVASGTPYGPVTSPIEKYASAIVDLLEAATHDGVYGDVIESLEYALGVWITDAG